MSTDDSPELKQLYADFESLGLAPLWTQTAELMPRCPAPQAIAHCWRWQDLLPLAERAGSLVPVGRGGERRAIALANPGLAGRPYATPTLWAAVQYLGPREVAPAHRHSQGAFRFVLEGEGVWTVVDGDPVAMRRGDLLLTPGMCWHEHHNVAEDPMVWLDGLDIPLVSSLDAGFFELGPDVLADRSTPEVSRSELLWAYPGLRPVAAADDTMSSPLVAYRWAATDAALEAQLELESAGYDVTIERGHAGVRMTNPTTGRDALPTLRTELHRLLPGTRTATCRRVGSAVWQVFDGRGSFLVGDRPVAVSRGDLVAVPSWCPVSVEAAEGLDLFVFSDEPVYEAVGLARTESSPAAP